jgi:hypothetical protein
MVIVRSCFCCVVLGTDSTRLVMSVVKFCVSGTVSTGFYTMSCVIFLSTMMMTFSSHLEAFVGPLSLFLVLFFAFTLLPVNALSLVAKIWR